MPLELAVVDAVEVLGAVAQGFGPRAQFAGVSIKVESGGEPVLVRADRERLRQMVAALVDNALRHTPPGGSIVLEAWPEAGAAYLAVLDTGPGIPVADLPHVFERFYRADPARARVPGTSGLGLSIVRALAVAQDGSAGAENVEPHGARFWLRLGSASVKAT